jgi:hypothetical protein
MKINLLPLGNPIDPKTGEWTDVFANFFEQQQVLMQNDLSDNGFVIPSHTNKDMAILQGNPQIPVGTLIFNTDAVNGGSFGAPNGQLYIKLQDGVFHPVTNT